MRLRAVLVCCAAALVAGAAQATPPNVITAVEYTEPTTRYPHGVLGDRVEWGALKMTVDMCSGCSTDLIRDFVIRLPQNRVFEDVAPRLVEIDGDESPEVLTVESDTDLGARLAIYYESGLMAATPFIGRANRWLAPLGAVDLDGDGQVEVAYVDRPHLAKTLRIWRWQDDDLVEVAAMPGLTNHRIGEDYISGGLRDCGDGPEMVLADASWTNIVVARFDGSGISVRPVAPFEGRRSFDPVLACAQ